MRPVSGGRCDLRGKVERLRIDDRRLDLKRTTRNGRVREKASKSMPRFKLMPSDAVVGLAQHDWHPSVAPDFRNGFPHALAWIVVIDQKSRAADHRHARLADLFYLELKVRHRWNVLG